MPPKPAETLNDPNAPTAFRSFWTAQAGPARGGGGEMFDYQGGPPSSSSGHPHAHAHGDEGHGHAHSGGGGHSHSHGGGASHGHGESREDTPLLASGSASSSSSSSTDGRILGVFRSYSALCYCLLPLLLALLLLGFFLYRSAAPAAGAASAGGAGAGAGVAAFCNPFALLASSVDLRHHHGLVATLYVLPSAQQSSAQSTSYYLRRARSSNATFFFSQLDTPTRLFTRPFEAHNLSSGEAVLLPSMFFLLAFHTVLQPPPSSLPAASANASASYYQLALLSDDGAALYAGDWGEHGRQQPGSAARLIDNDGVHTTRLATSSALRLDHAPLNLTLHYFQGPPAHIALQLLYRPLQQPREARAEVGEEGNALYWTVRDEGLPSTPTQRYAQLLDDGWAVVPAGWFWLPPRYDGQEDVERKLAAGIDPCL